MVDGVVSGEVLSKKTIEGFFQHSEDGFVILLPHERSSVVVADGGGTLPRPHSGATLQNRQGGRIILIYNRYSMNHAKGTVQCRTQHYLVLRWQIKV